MCRMIIIKLTFILPNSKNFCFVMAQGSQKEKQVGVEECLIFLDEILTDIKRCSKIIDKWCGVI